MKKILLAIMSIVVIFLIVVGIFRNPSDYIANGTIILGWLVFAIQTFWITSENFYLFFKNIWYKMKNPDCSWDLVIELNEVNNQPIDEIFGKIEKILVAKKMNNFKIIPLSNVRKMYIFGTFTITVVIDGNNIRFGFNSFEVSYRRSSEIISQELSHIFEDIQRELNSGKTLCYLDIFFSGENPYYGVYIRKLDAKNIERFTVEFKVNNQQIIINKEKISIRTNSFIKLQEITKKYLTLSPK